MEPLAPESTVSTLLHPKARRNRSKRMRSYDYLIDEYICLDERNIPGVKTRFRDIESCSDDEDSRGDGHEDGDACSSSSSPAVAPGAHFDEGFESGTYDYLGETCISFSYENNEDDTNDREHHEQNGREGVSASSRLVRSSSSSVRRSLLFSFNDLDLSDNESSDGDGDGDGGADDDEEEPDGEEGDDECSEGDDEPGIQLSSRVIVRARRRKFNRLSRHYPDI